jgi:diguanylate cyclase (GGDEF)-like protein
MSKSALGALLLGVILLVLGPLAVAETMAQQRHTDDELRHDGAQLASAFTAYFERARSLNLLLAENPDLRMILDAGQTTPEVNASANNALEYLENLYPGAIGEACLIDDQGAEIARVTKGVPAPMDDLSTNEAENAFFRATLDLAPGEVYQAAPYVSPDTDEWVISNSTPVVVAGGRRLLVHFEVSLASFASSFGNGSSGRDAAVVDAANGRVLLEQGADLPAPGTEFRLLEGWESIGAMTGTGPRSISVDGEHLAVTPVPSSEGNANHWLVVYWSHERTGPLPVWLGLSATIAGALLILLLVLALRAQNATLRRAARLDYLTGMANRRALEEELERAVAASLQQGERVALVALDLDGFKQINDTFGHHCGDLVLREVGRRLHANTFEYDTAARVGGDEYAVVLRHLNDDMDLAAVGHRLRDALMRPIEVDGVRRLVGVTVGLAACPDHATTPDDLLRAADASMYRAKRGREGVVVYESGTAVGAEESRLAAELLMAIEQEQVRLVFQPARSLETGRIVTVEALARWQRSDGTHMSPSHFVPLAEETGLIRPLTVLTLRKALDELVLWRAAGIEAHMSVNLSSRLVTDRTFPSLVEEMLGERGLSGASLILEVTETAVIARVSDARVVLQALRDLGIRIELDDFGSGYASTRSLRDIPLDGVKLDRDMVNDTTPSGRTMLATTIDLGRVLDLYIVAEGIENAATLEMVKALGADVAQGAHLARPMEAKDIRLLLAGESVELGTLAPR